jgi:transposase
MADIEENARRKASGKKEIPLSPIAIEVVRRIDALFEIERSINGKSAEERLATRHALSRPLVDDLHAYVSAQLARLARGHDPKRSTTFSCVGRPSRCSLKMAALASRTTPPSVACAA